MQSLYAVLFALAFVVGHVSAARPDDEIRLLEFNESLFIANETYTFALIPQFQVPLQVNRHVIYTATSAVVNQGIKRALLKNKQNLYDLSPEDHEHLSAYMKEHFPSYLKVNTRKRSLPRNELGYNSIPLARNVVILHKPGNPTLKRADDGVPLGASLCLHVPFFTTCDNSQDLTDVKNALQAQANAFYTEIDSYEATNNKRANEMAATLDNERNLLMNLSSELSATLSFISTLANAAAINAAQIAHGDYIIHAQTDYLKRVSNSLLTFSNALASTDPRSLVAQPSLSKLFEGFQTVTQYLRNESYLPILDSRTFNWTEVVLPTSALNNIVTFNDSFVSDADQIANSMGFRAVTTMTCSTPGLNTPYRCPTPFMGTLAMRDANTPGGDQWLFGVFHQNHVGIYPLVGNATETVATTSFGTVVWTGGSTPPVARVPAGTSQLYCVDFLGFKSIATFQTTPNMLNGITPGTAASPITDCNNYRFRNVTGFKHYFLFGIREGMVIPFYSNCNVSQLVSETNPSIPIGYMINYPSTASTLRTDLGVIPPTSIYTTYQINSHHFASKNCYLNLEPDWLALSYYIPDTTEVISNIPRGYKINQFTINPAGELSSSLEFLYTNQWAWAYQIRRISSNQIIVDEASVLDGKLVLFNLQGSQVVDESDSFYGEGNNGRDCIHARSTYDYDLLSCFFQNNQQGSYSADQYLAGSITTSGIARFVEKFTFSLSPWNTTALDGHSPVQSYQFTLIPKADADFSYSVQSQVCPTLTAANSTVQGCQYQFFYQGNKTITFGSTPVTFDTKTFLSNVQSVSFSDPNPLRTVYAAGKSCMLLQCRYGGTTDTSTVKVETPMVSIVTADDKALVSKVSFAVDDTLNTTILTMVQVQAQVAEAQKNLSLITQALGTLDFNVTRLVPYEDFTELRNQVAAMVDSLQPEGTRSCASGVFGTAGCWINDALSILITVVIVAAVAIGLYCACFKFGLAKKLFGGCCGGKY